MANSSGVFCRVGSEEDKRESDRRKVQFCHRNGDLFTFLSVYRQWENLPPENRNRWCWDNSVNAKAMRRCHETVREIKACLEHELHLIVPSYWRWTPEHDGLVKHIILSALPENVATFSGNDHVGYEVAVNGTHVPLHPSCSLLAFADRPIWVVFGEILATHNRFLVCVTSVDLESLYALSPPPPFDVSEIDGRRLRRKVLTGFGTMLLKKFCGRLGSGLKHLMARIRAAVRDDRVTVHVSVDRNEVDVFASARDMDEVCEFVNDSLARERKWLRNECLEKCLYTGRRASAQVALFGAGAEIKHLELENRCLTVDVYHPTPNDVDEKELLSFLERHTSGGICGVHRFGPEGNGKWGRVTFLTPAAAEAAAAAIVFDGVSLRVVPTGGENRFVPFPAVKAKVSWPRRRNRGFAFVKCATVNDVSAVVGDLSRVLIGGKFIRSKQSSKFTDTVILNRIDSEVFDDEIYEAVAAATDRRVLDIHVPRGDPVDHPPVAAVEDALLREIRSFMAGSERVRVHVFEPKPRDHSVRAEINFDGSLHLEAARALELIQGKAVPGCEPWQKVKCYHQFHSSVSCPAAVYYVIRDPLDSLLRRLRLRKGAELNLDRNENGSYRVRISAKATKIMADLRRPLEELMNGKMIHDPRLTPPILELVFSRDGFALQRSVQRETETYFLIDRQSHGLRVFGPLEKLDAAHQRMVQALLELHERKQLDVNLRGGGLPSDVMKTVVERFGPDLCGLKERFPGSDFTLNTRDHVISVRGPKDAKRKVEDAIRELAQTGGGPGPDAAACAICLCDVDDGYRLETCRHKFCRGCLLEQCESAARSHDGFPLRCARGGCGEPLLVADLKAVAPAEKLDGLFRAAVGAFVTAACGEYRFCPSPDCPAVYRVADPGGEAAAFACGACLVETCRRCHVEYHPFVSCEMYREFKRHPDTSLEEWVKGREGVKRCPGCGFTIEKVDGCNHVECRCGRHICWVCRDSFLTSDECYGHLRSVHHAIG